MKEGFFLTYVAAGVIGTSVEPGVADAHMIRTVTVVNHRVAILINNTLISYSTYKIIIEI